MPVWVVVAMMLIDPGGGLDTAGARGLVVAGRVWVQVRVMVALLIQRQMSRVRLLLCRGGLRR